MSREGVCVSGELSGLWECGNRTEGEADYRCVNIDCPARLWRAFSFFGAESDEYRWPGRGACGAVAGAAY